MSFIAGLDFAPLLVAARSRDQRKLGRTGRIGNMRHSLTALAGASMPAAVIVVDDVCTTGATLFAATEALRTAGAKIVCASRSREPRTQPFAPRIHKKHPRGGELADPARFATLGNGRKAGKWTFAIGFVLRLAC